MMKLQQLPVTQDDPFAAFAAPGLGYGGYCGPVGHVAAQPFVLTPEMADQMQRIGEALQEFFVVVNSLARQGDKGVVDVLGYGVDASIPRESIKAPAQTCRPDMICTKDGRLLVTEIESAPGGHGFVAALQGETSSLVDMYVRRLMHPKTGRARPMRTVLTHCWSEYLFEQAHFCRCLAGRGIDAKVIVTAPLTVVQERAEAEWCPRPGVHLVWDTAIGSRLAESGLADYVEFCTGVPDSFPPDALVFMMGYARHWGADGMQKLQQLERRQVQFLNGGNFILGSKTLMAAVRIPSVRKALLKREAGEKTLHVLDAHIAPTWVVQPTSVLSVSAEYYDQFAGLRDSAGQAKCPWAASLDYAFSEEGRGDLVLKVAGHAPGEVDWGARAMFPGREHKQPDWCRYLVGALGAGYPSVLQRYVPSEKYAIPCWVQTPQGPVFDEKRPLQRARFTPFVLANGDKVMVDPGLATFGIDVKVHGGTGSTMAKVNMP